MLAKDNNIFFLNDQEFEDFCRPNILIGSAGDLLYFFIELSDEYYEAEKQGKHFMICDPKSKIAKRHCITKNTACHYIPNLIRYNNEFDLRRYNIRASEV